jgi:mannose-6-phosphate isomerase-like protein (cupin superfamily)
MIKHTKKYNLNVPSWETLLENLNWSITNNKIVKHKCPGFLISHQAYKIKEVKPILKDLKLDDAHLYINLCKGDTMGRHWDGTDVYFWQVKGTSIWHFDTKKVTLKTGDLLYIPKKTWHGVEATEPRAGISMSIDYTE